MKPLNRTISMLKKSIIGVVGAGIGAYILLNIEKVFNHLWSILK